MAAPTYRSIWPTYAQALDNIKFTRPAIAAAAAKKLLANKDKYQAVEAKTGVPWWWIACTHNRESDADFSTQLAQGDPLNRVSTNVPRGQGPYYGDYAWERAAIVALEDHKLDKVVDWRLEKALYWWESFNGWGYYNHGRPSAYVFAGTSIYDPPSGPGGKYIADGVWSGSAVDKQLGCVAVLAALMDLDHTIQIERETPEGVADEPKAPTPVQPAPPQPPTPTPVNVPAQPQEPPVSTQPTPTPVPAAPGFSLDVDKINGYIDVASNVLNMISAFVPQARLAQPFVPIAKELVEFAGEISQGKITAANALTVIAGHMHDIGDQLAAAGAALKKQA